MRFWSTCKYLHYWFLHMLLCFLLRCSVCKLSEYIYVYFGSTVLFLAPVEWQVCLCNSHKSQELRGPASRTHDGDSHSASSRSFHQEVHSVCGLGPRGLNSSTRLSLGNKLMWVVNITLGLLVPCFRNPPNRKLGFTQSLSEPFEESRPSLPQIEPRSPCSPLPCTNIKEYH